ncbi:MAG TPA: biopolymer transporter ExbD [Allosphingosinicella sp.]|nr:biopolymer transporter ExbD [Allosphingosinicella sp.]
MAMQVGESGGEEDAPMSDINTTPLVDVMLVLLIIFLIAVPVVLQSVQLTLPTVRYQVTETKPENVNLSVRLEPDGTCGVYRNLTRVTSDELYEFARTHLENQINAVGGRQNITEDNMPEAHIRGDVATPYRCIGAAIYTMQRAGFARIGFISEPAPEGGQRL